PRLHRLQGSRPPWYGHLGMAQPPDDVRTVSTEVRRRDIQLDDRRGCAWNLPIVCALASGMTADEKDQVGLGHSPVGAPAGVGSYDSQGEWVIIGDRSLAIQ